MRGRVGVEQRSLWLRFAGRCRIVSSVGVFRRRRRCVADGRRRGVGVGVSAVGVWGAGSAGFGGWIVVGGRRRRRAAGVVARAASSSRAARRLGDRRDVTTRRLGRLLAERRVRRPRPRRARAPPCREQHRAPNASSAARRRGCRARRRRTAGTSPARAPSARRSSRSVGGAVAALPRRQAAACASGLLRRRRASAGSRGSIGESTRRGSASRPAPTGCLSGRARGRAQRGGGGPPGTMSRPVGSQLLVELELPVVAGEGHARRGTRRRGARSSRRRPSDDQLRVAAAGQGRVDGRGEGAAEARVDVGDAEPDVAGRGTPGSSPGRGRRAPPSTRRPSSISSSSRDHLRP